MDAIGEVTAVPRPTSAAQWNEALQNALARQQGTGEAPIAAVRSLTGLERLRGVLEGRLPRLPMTDVLGFYPIEVERGRAVFQGAPKPEYSNAMGSTHGGWGATLLDSCMGWAVYSMVAAGQLFTTLELKTNFVRALAFDAGPVRAEGKVINAGRTIVTAEGRLFGADSRLYAHATATCLIVPVDK